MLPWTPKNSRSKIAHLFYVTESVNDEQISCMHPHVFYHFLRLGWFMWVVFSNGLWAKVIVWLPGWDGVPSPCSAFPWSRNLGRSVLSGFTATWRGCFPIQSGPHLSKNKLLCIKLLRLCWAGELSDTAAKVLYLNNIPHDMGHWIGELLFSDVLSTQFGNMLCLIFIHGSDWKSWKLDGFFKKWETISSFLIIVVFGKIKNKSMKTWLIGKTV